MFYDNFIKQCELKGISPSRVLDSLIISRGSLGRWKNGGEPRNEAKKKIAEYFGITVAELVSGTKIENPGASDEVADLEKAKKEKPITNSDDGLEENVRLFLKLDPDERKAVLRYLRFLAHGKEQP